MDLKKEEEMPKSSKSTTQQSDAEAGYKKEEENAYESDPFDIPSIKNASTERIRKWRKAALALNASRRFRYTLDIKKEEEKRQILKKIKANGQVLRAAVLNATAVMEKTAALPLEQPVSKQNLNNEECNVQLEVMRGGRSLKISNSDIVVGDVIPLRIGDQVPADGILISGYSFGIDESSITGETKRDTNKGETEPTVPQDEHDRILHEMNSLKEQLRQRVSELNMLKKQLIEKQEHVDLCKKGNLNVLYEGESEQCVLANENHRVLQERHSLKDQLSRRDEETTKLKQQISEKDEQVSLLKSEVCGLKDDIESLSLFLNISPCIWQTIVRDNSRGGLEKMEPQFLAASGSHAMSRDQFDDKNRVRKEERDLVGVSATPMDSFSYCRTPLEAATTDSLSTSYNHVELLLTLMRQGLVIPRSLPMSDESCPRPCQADLPQGSLRTFQ